MTADTEASGATPLVVVISGPSGVGKDTLIERMAELGYDHHFTVTATTRSPRPGERDGVNHYFVDKEEFEGMISRDELLEWARVYGNYYGVPKQQVRDALRCGRHVVLRVDVQGSARLRSVVPEALFLFILPPSMEVLRTHLITRGVNSDEDIENRLAAAVEEMKQTDLYDYLLVNEEGMLDATAARVRTIIERESRRDPPRNVTI